MSLFPLNVFPSILTVTPWGTKWATWRPSSRSKAMVGLHIRYFSVVMESLLSEGSANDTRASPCALCTFEHSETGADDNRVSILVGNPGRSSGLKVTFTLARGRMIPKRCFLTKGVGIHKEKLASFELALRSAGLAYCNLVLVSSIFPPGCKRISKEDGVKLLRPGEIVFCVYDRESTNEPNRLVVASVGVAIPADQQQYGYLSEHHAFGETEEKAGDYAEDLAATMLATTLGIEFDPDTAWDERENLFKMSGKIVRTSNITQSAIGNKDGLWTTVFAACAFVNDDN